VIYYSSYDVSRGKGLRRREVPPPAAAETGTKSPIDTELLEQSP